MTMSVSRISLLAALLPLLVALLSLAPPSTAQSAFLLKKAKTLRAAADKAAADLKAAQADAAKLADEVTADTQALADLIGRDATLDNLITNLAEMNASLDNAQYDLDIANQLLVLKRADLAAFRADPAHHPQIPAAQKAASDATRRATMTSALLREWKNVMDDAAQAVSDAQKALKENPESEQAQAALAEAEDMQKGVIEVFPDMVAQDQRAQARVARMTKELSDLQTKGPQSESIFQMAVDDATAAVSVARKVYTDTLAAVTDAQNALNSYQANRVKAVTDMKEDLAKAKMNQSLAEKKVLQLADKLKVALAQADNAEKAAGIRKKA